MQHHGEVGCVVQLWFIAFAEGMSAVLKAIWQHCGKPVCSAASSQTSTKTPGRLGTQRAKETVVSVFLIGLEAQLWHRISCGSDVLEENRSHQVCKRPSGYSHTWFYAK